MIRLRPALLAVLTAVLIAALGLAGPLAAAAQTQGAGAPGAQVPGAQAQGALAQPAPAAGQPQSQPVIFVGVSGLEHEDLDRWRTPHLWSLVENGSIGTMTPRSVRSTSCPADGWLAVSSGRRAADESAAQCRTLQPPLSGWTADWDVYQEKVAHDRYDADLGALAAAVPDLHAIGPGAAIAAAESDGRVRSYESLDADLGDQVRTAAEHHPLVLIDLGNVRTPGYSITELDDHLGDILAAYDEHAAGGADSAQSLLMVASIADGWTESSSMQFAAIQRPGEQPGILTSPSTKQPGLIQTTDIMPTLVRATGAQTDANLAGAPITTASAPASAGDRYQLMLDRQVAVATQAAMSVWFYPVFAGLMAALLAVAALVGRRAWPRVINPLRAGGLFFAAIPVSTYLVNVIPWERSTSPDVAMLAALGGWALALTLAGLLGPWKRFTLGPLTFVAVATVLVLAGDVITGSHLQMSTLLGEPLLIASRFYGIGNSALALFLTALVFALITACSLIANRWVRLSVVLVTMVLACLLLATPGLGTKFGSVPALVVGLGVLALAAAEIRASIKRLALIVGTTAGIMIAVLVIDWLRPADDRTHFGRFFASIISGEAGAVLMRKIGMNIDILTQSWMTLLLPLIIAAVFWAAIAPGRFRIPALPRLYARFPYLRMGMISLAVLLGVGAVVNDSGIIVPAVGLLFLIPALAHLVGRQAAECQRESRARRPRSGEPGAEDRPTVPQSQR
ncbi:hypothetical protein [Brevibacterium gallinarum]|uniref:Phosphoglyceromutase n=1 Tax=Brevibacterium gallinarum TaxID=2762220 RepID=A0ABR8WVS9_9MICO|nr:hypothetical protein [Brevibacterium gallinarum]MBD8021196.1 hypothetical protein [Brevibacterium gallinarum]